MMENEKTMMDTTMDYSMMEMDAMPKKMSMECTFKGLIKNQMIDLEEMLMAAKVKYADAMLEDKEWSDKYDTKLACQIIKEKMEILTKLEKDFDNMTMSQMSMQ